MWYCLEANKNAFEILDTKRPRFEKRVKQATFLKQFSEQN